MNQPRPAKKKSNVPAKKDPNMKPSAPADQPEGEEEEQEEEQEEGEGTQFLMFNVMPSWMVSFLTHIAVIILLALLVMPARKDRTIALETGEQAAEALEEISLDFDAMDFSEEDPLETELSEEEPTEVTEIMEVSLPEAEVDFGNIMGAEEAFEAEGELNPSEFTEETGGRSDGASKKALLAKHGGNAESEAAVALALKWIIKHQLPDGGWDLDHTIGPGNHRDSPNPGSLKSARSAATALAILPLLGAGHTHETGEYKYQVRAGLEFLMKRAKRSGRGISYLEPGGNMYSHGLVSIVFCEAFAMTEDSALAPYAQGTVWFIEDAQDPSGGGWRYQPKEAGDTSAVGWQLMALKSAKISGLNINPNTYKGVEKFLDSVSSHYGAFYGYTTAPNGKPADARTAIGLLCRMYMGWGKNVPGIIDGVGALSDKGPSVGKANMYYNYYATQTMKHYGGREWKEWNKVMRDFLVESQETKGNMTGSWFWGGHTGDRGGRLCETSLACMTLEVYYRYLPLYGDKAANDEFPLE